MRKLLGLRNLVSQIIIAILVSKNDWVSVDRWNLR